MIGSSRACKVWACPAPVDLRKGFDGLAFIVDNTTRRTATHAIHSVRPPQDWGVPVHFCRQGSRLRSVNVGIKTVVPPAWLGADSVQA